MDAKSAALVRAWEGDVIVIPMVLSRELGIAAAAFLRQAAYFSAITESRDGWFFLDQEGYGNSEASSIFLRAGSWQYMLGMGPDAQLAIRRRLRELGLLEESRKGMVHGRLMYRVDPDRYLAFMVQCERSNAATPNAHAQSGNPDCSSGAYRLITPEMPGANYQRHNQVDAAACMAKPPSQTRDAASEPSNTRKRLRQRPSGIVTWYDDEAPLAEQIESAYPADEISQAVRNIRSRYSTSGKPLYPVPGLVTQELRTMAEQRLGQGHHEHRLHLSASVPLNAEFTERGAKLLPTNLRQRFNLGTVAANIGVHEGGTKTGGSE